MHRRWLAGLRFAHAAHHIVLEDAIAAVEAATSRRDRLEAQIAAALSDWSLATWITRCNAARLVSAATTSMRRHGVGLRSGQTHEGCLGLEQAVMV